MANGVDAMRQEISAAKSEVKDDLRHESAARDSALQSFLDSALETMRRMQTENTAALDKRESENKAAQEKHESDIKARLDRHESDNKAVLAKYEADNREAQAKYEADNKEAQAKRDAEHARRDADLERREKRLMVFIVIVVGVAMAIGGHVFQ